MAKGYDGEIIINTELNSDGLKRGSKEIEQSLKRTANTLKGLSDQQKAQVQSLTASFNSLNRLYAEQARQVENLKKKQEQLNNAPQSNKTMERIEAQMDKVEQEYNNLIAKQRQLQNDILPPDLARISSPDVQQNILNQSSEYVNLKAKIDATKASRDNLNAAYQREAASYASDIERQKAANMDALNDATSRLANTTRGLDDAYEAAENQIKSYAKNLSKATKENQKNAASAKGVHRGLKNVEKSSKRAGMSLGRMLLQSLLFSIVFRIFSAVMSSMGEAVNALALQSDSANAALSALQSSLQYLSASFVAAFSPLLEYVAPALSTFIDLIAQAVAWIGQLFAALTGKSTYTKAIKVQKDYAASLKETGAAASGAAKDAKLALLSFDELNQLNAGGSSGGGGGGAGGGGTGTEFQYEEVAVDSALVKGLEYIKTLVGEIAALFNSGFKFGFVDTGSIEVIKESLKSIKESLIDIFGDPAVQNAAGEWAANFIYQLGVIAGAVTSIGGSIAANLIGGIAQFLEENKDSIKQYLVNMFDINTDIMTILGYFSVALATIASALSGANGIAVTANLIALFSNAFMGITEMAGRWVRDILDVITRPIIENADLIKQKLDEFFKPLGDTIGNLADIVKNTFDIIKAYYDSEIAPLLDNLAGNFSVKFGEITEVLMTFLTNVMYVISAVTGILSGIIEFIAGVFTNDWEKAWNGIQKGFDNTWDLINSILDLAINLMKLTIDSALNFIASIWGEKWESIRIKVDEKLEEIRTIMHDKIEEFKTFMHDGIENIKNNWDGSWEQIGETTGEIFEQMKETIKGSINAIIGFVEGMANRIVDGVNKVINALNSLSIDIPDNPITGPLSFGFDIPTLSHVSLPRLASGTVIPPQAGEFAAILGDNNRETEVVSPLSTMKQALVEALAEAGITGEQVIYLNFTGNLAQLARVLKPAIDSENNRVGVRIVTGGAR